jgi:uncharacterized membrane protein
VWTDEEATLIRGDAVREYTRASLWVLPAACAVVALVAGSLMSLVDVGPGSPIAFQGTADDARALLIGIASTMVTVIALLLGLAVVALQLASTQFSPRLLRNFLRDRPNQIVLGVFVGTFAYSTAGLFTVGVASGQRVDQFPRLAVTVAIVLLFVSLGLLVYFADHLAHSIQVDNVMRIVERTTLPVIQRLEAGGESPDVPEEVSLVPAPSSGYLQVVHIERLLTLAATAHIHIRVHPTVGEHIVEGAPLASVWPITTEGRPVPATLPRSIASEIRIGFERTLEQDPGFGLRQLVDAACKALSPAVNDPYTAIQAIDHLSVLYAGLAARPLGDYVAHDSHTGATVTVPRRSFAEHLSLGVGLIRRYGAAEPTVICALLRLLTAALHTTGRQPQRWEAIETETALLLVAADRETAESADLTDVHSATAALRQELKLRREQALP